MHARVKSRMSFCACAKLRDLFKIPKISYCTRSPRCRFAVLYFKIEHIVAFTAIFSNICTAHSQKWLLVNFRSKFRHRHLICQPRFPSRVQNFGDVFRWFLHFICWISAIFLLPVCLTYWPRKYTTHVNPHVDNSHQVWRPYAYPFLSSYEL